MQKPDDTGPQEARGAPPKPQEQAAASEPTALSFSDFELIDLDAVPVVVPEVVDVRAAIETIPRLLTRISGIWGTQDLDVFLNKLVMDSRDGGRRGFPVEVAEELLFMTQLKKMVRAYYLAKANNISLDASFKLVDKGDDDRLRHDVWDNPTSSPGTAFREKSQGAAASRQEAEERGNPPVSLFMFLVKLLFNKWIAGGIAILLIVKFIWGA